MFEQNENGGLDDQSLDQILGLASGPVLSSGFEGRVMAVLAEQVKPTAQVIAFPRRRSPSVWLMGLPLAACLMLGVWLGANGELSDLLPASAATVTMATADLLSPSGVDDIENLNPGDLS